MARVDIDHPASFKDGIRVLLLMQRHKEGGSARTDRKATIKRITTSPVEFDEALVELRKMWLPDHRIYASVDARDLKKAIRFFQFRMLEANWFAPQDRDAFYLDMENRWISALKDPKAGATQLFLFDFDGPTSNDQALEFQKNYPNIQVVDAYPTKNGTHMITKPFNPSLVSNELNAIRHGNALMLWSY